MYTRLYSYSKILVFDNSYHIYTIHQLSNINWFIHTFSIYGLYLLNIYWGGIIIKKWFKPFKHIKYFQQIYCESILQYTMFPPVLYSIYMYYTNTVGLGWLDIVGQALLSITSYRYHRELKNELEIIYPNTNVDVLKNERIMWYYLDDVSVINLRSFLNLVIHFHNMGRKTSVFHWEMISVSGSIHLLSLYLYIRNIVCIKVGGDGFNLEETNGKKANMIYVLSGLPIFLDIAMGCFYLEYIHAHHILFSFYLCMIILYLRPVYQSSHLLFHFVIWYQTYYVVKANIYNSGLL